MSLLRVRKGRCFSGGGGGMTVTEARVDSSGKCTCRGTSLGDVCRLDLRTVGAAPSGTEQENHRK